MVPAALWDPSPAATSLFRVGAHHFFVATLRVREIVHMASPGHFSWPAVRPRRISQFARGSDLGRPIAGPGELIPTKNQGPPRLPHVVRVGGSAIPAWPSFVRRSDVEPWYAVRLNVSAAAHSARRERAVVEWRSQRSDWLLTNYACMSSTLNHRPQEGIPRSDRISCVFRVAVQENFLGSRYQNMLQQHRNPAAVNAEFRSVPRLAVIACRFRF